MPPKTKLREKQLEQYFVRQCKKHGIKQYKFTSPGNRSVADRIMFVRGGFTILVELKRPGGDLTPLQEKFADELTALEFDVFMANSKEKIDEIIQLSKRYAAGHS